MDPKFDAKIEEECAKASTFGGVAHTLDAAPKKPAEPAHYPVPTVDDTQPLVKIQVRTAAGPRPFSLNATHTVAHLKALIAKETGHVGAFDLQQAYPKKVLSNDETLTVYGGSALQMI